MMGASISESRRPVFTVARLVLRNLKKKTLYFTVAKLKPKKPDSDLVFAAVQIFRQRARNGKEQRPS
jgi:hypothetical protein